MLTVAPVARMTVSTASPAILGIAMGVGSPDLGHLGLGDVVFQRNTAQDMLQEFLSLYSIGLGLIMISH